MAARFGLILMGLACLLLMLAAGLVGKLLTFLAWAVDGFLAVLERLVGFLGEHAEDFE